MTLGLFPLNLVLFPDTRLPLHIFEPRYRALISECLERGSLFGINLMERGHLHPAGCMARVVQITETYPDGRMDVIVEGVSRFRLLATHDDVKAYAVGDVVPLDDDELVPTDPILLADCVQLYDQIIELVYGNSGSRFDLENLGTKSASFIMAPKCGITTDQKQQLLELTTENSRLELLRDHLAEIVPTIRKAELIQRVIKSDGYLPTVS